MVSACLQPKRLCRKRQGASNSGPKQAKDIKEEAELWIVR